VPTDYSRPFDIEGPVGNNALSYEKRLSHASAVSGPAPKLSVPSIIAGSFDDVEPGDTIAFEDFDEHGVLQSCAGLSHLVRTSWDGVPTVVTDNHNHAFYFWAEAGLAGVLQPNATLIHVDQHRDMRVPERMFDGTTLEDAFSYTNFHLNVGNYIVPAERAGLVGEIQMVTSEEALRDFGLVDRGNKILNLDLDFFAPEMSYIDFELARRFITTHRQTASLITIATSPFFIDQAGAISALKRLL
jgi:hypothetical protein